MYLGDVPMLTCFVCRLLMSVHKRIDTSVIQSSAYTPLLYVALSGETQRFQFFLVV